MTDEPLLVLREVSVTYTRNRTRVRAVSEVSLEVAAGEIVGVVGESGCGKSSLARAALGLMPASGGEVAFAGAPVPPLRRGRRPDHLCGLQMIFQDPYASLNSRRTVGDTIGDFVRATQERRARRGLARPDAGEPIERVIGELLEQVGLPASAARRYPHEFSGGQRQRIAIARMLATEPSLIIADEPISALDASAQAYVANLLVRICRERGIGLLFISHDLSVVRAISDRVAVMYLGRIVEQGPTAQIWSRPAHPYTRALINAIPRPDGAGALPRTLPGDVPDPARPPAGCAFHPRCPIAVDRCASAVPPPVPVEAGWTVRCVRHTPPGPEARPASTSLEEPAR